MIGLGTVINTAAIIIGGFLGMFFGKLLNERIRSTLNIACSLSVIFIGLSGALEGILSIVDKDIVSSRSMLIVASLCIGALIGEALNIEDAFERFGEWLKQKTGNSKDFRFVDAFVSSSLTVCIGAMAIIGSIKDGTEGDISILVTKAILDMIIILVMSGSKGLGCIFSALPVAVFQGTLTALSTLIKPIMTSTALENLSLIGSILVFCVGINLMFGKKIRVANLLPSIIIAVVAAFIKL